MRSLFPVGCRARNTASMVRLSKPTEQRDILDVLAASRREIRLTLQSERPLRKGTN